jgi:hypothetical protein
MLKLFDKGIIDFFGPYGFVRFFHSNINTVSTLQTGFVYHYAGIVLNFIVLLFIFPQLDVIASTLLSMYFINA